MNNEPKPVAPIPPFKSFCGRIGAFPTAFTDAMTVYECLEWLYKYLDRCITPTLNANVTAVAELKEYVEHYFDNLDVQQEINNKLDDMAESGELAEIIAAYLETKAILAFDTPDDIKTADNLISGSYAKTYGYKRKGDGVYDYYIVRPVEIGDVDDGYNVISLTEDPTLVAIRLQQGSKRLIELSGDDNIQDYLDLDSKKEIVFPTGTTTVTDALILNSDTTIDLNGGTLEFDFNRSQIFEYDWDETLGFMTIHPDDTFTEYNGIKNVVIKNGSITGGCSSFLHAQNVTIDNVSFATSGGRHSIQIAACKNFVIENCTFNGVRNEDVTLASECINIDPCIYGAQPYISEYSSMWDNTANLNLTIKNNIFNQPTDETLVYRSAIGTHGGTAYSYAICDGLFILNNNFNNPDESSINTKNYSNVEISGNTTYYASAGNNVYFMVKRGYLRDANIHDNIIDGTTMVLFSGTPCLDGTRLNISSNQINSFDVDTDSYAVFQLFNVHDSNITGNSIITRHRAFHINTRHYRDSDVEDIEAEHTINLTINDNSIEKTENSTTYLGNRISTCNNVKILNNNFVHRGTLQANYETLYFQGTQTNISVSGNVTDQPRYFCRAEKVTSEFSGNNAIYLNGSNINATSATGTFDSALTNFGKMILQCGHSGNQQSVILYPQMSSTHKFDGSRTFQFATPKDDGTYGYGALVVSNSGGNWSYTGNIKLQYLYLQD